MTRDAALAHVADYYDRGAFQSELAELVTYRSESQNPAPEAAAGPHDAAYLFDRFVSVMKGERG